MKEELKYKKMRYPLELEGGYYALVKVSIFLNRGDRTRTLDLYVDYSL